jgi:hypothetical protein
MDYPVLVNSCKASLSSMPMKETAGDAETALHTNTRLEHSASPNPPIMGLPLRLKRSVRVVAEDMRNPLLVTGLKFSFCSNQASGSRQAETGGDIRRRGAHHAMMSGVI